MKIVRLADSPEHTGTVAGWLYEEWDSSRPNRSLARTEAYLRVTPDATGLPASFVAMSHGEPVGIARLVTHDMETRMDLSPWLAAVFVPESHRGNRIGTQLCRTVVDEARTLGFSTLYLFTPDRERFYVRQGWQTVEHTICKNKQVVLMRMDTGVNSAAPVSGPRSGDD